jgi:hypothetical protein
MNVYLPIAYEYNELNSLHEEHLVKNEYHNVSTAYGIINTLNSFISGYGYTYICTLG